MNKTKLKRLCIINSILGVAIMSAFVLISCTAKDISQESINEDNYRITTATSIFNELKVPTHESTHGQAQEQDKYEQDVPIATMPEQPETTNDETTSISLSEPLDPTQSTISLGKFRLTAYCPCEKCCDVWAENRPIDKNGNVVVYTASGEEAVEGFTIAADTNVLPFGTRVYINGHEYEVHDRGGGIEGNSIDIYFESHEDAVNFGLQYADVSIKSN